MFRFSPFRNRRFVSRPIQGPLMMRVGLYWVLYHVVLWHALLVYRYVQHRISGGAGQTPVSFGEQFGQLLLDYSPVLLCGLLTLPVVLIDMLSVSHRIAGPLVQFGSALRDLRDGRTIDRVALRRQDLLTEFQQDFNEYLAWLGQQSVPSAAPVETPPCLTRAEAQIVAQTGEVRPSMSETAPMAGDPDNSREIARCPNLLGVTAPPSFVGSGM